MRYRLRTLLIVLATPPPKQEKQGAQKIRRS